MSYGWHTQRSYIFTISITVILRICIYPWNYHHKIWSYPCLAVQQCLETALNIYFQGKKKPYFYCPIPKDKLPEYENQKMEKNIWLKWGSPIRVLLLFSQLHAQALSCSPCQGEHCTVLAEVGLHFCPWWGLLQEPLYILEPAGIRKGKKIGKVPFGDLRKGCSKRRFYWKRNMFT